MSRMRRMKANRVPLWAVMSLLAISSVFSCACAQENGSNVQRFIVRAREGYNPLKEQQLDVSRSRASWIQSQDQRRISAGQIRREGNDIAQQCAADLFALFGGRIAASAVEKTRAKELLDCVHVLAPDSESELLHCDCESEMETLRNGEQPDSCQTCGILRENCGFKKKIAFPPDAVQQLARKTVEWGGDVNVVLNALGPKTYAVPDVEGSTEDRCTLTKYDDGKRFADKDVTDYMAFLFKAIAKLSPSVGLNISLNRFDLFHGHMFTTWDTGRLGILFHSREYPAYDDWSFPLNLGFCQKGSTLPYDASMALRNIVWLAPMPDCSQVLNSSNQTCSRKWLAPGALFVLDTGEGKILDRELVPDYLDVVHTVSEDDLGDVMIDVNYFNFVNETLDNRVFLC